MRITRQRALLMVGVLLLLGAAIAQAVAEHNPSGPPLASQDGGPSGSLALGRWLQALGYSVDRIEETTALEPVEILFILDPVRRFERAETQAVLDWVRRGGVLLYTPGLVVFTGLAPTPSAGDGLADELEVGVRFGPYVEQATPALPFFTNPPAERFLVKANRGLDLRNDAWTPMIRDGTRAFAATREFGGGRVYVATSDTLLANQGIADEDNLAFVLNVLAHHPTRRAISFEEYHHAVVERPNLANEVRTSPWGWSLLYAALLSFVFLLWAGRRFGPAVVAERAPARSGGEYVAAFAGLLQKARAAGWVQQQYAGLARRRLARILGVRANLPVADLARLLAERRPIEQAALAEHLAALDGPPLGQRSLLGHVRAVEPILRASSERGAGSGQEAYDAGG